MKQSFVLLCLFAALALLAFDVHAEELDVQLEDQDIHAEKQESIFYDSYLKDTLQIGLRETYQTLTDSDSGAKGGTQGEGTFLGTIYALDEVQNYLPNLYATYFFSKYWGVELAYDSAEAETVATSIGSSIIKSDGDVSLAGPTLSLVGRYPNRTKFTPYVSVGLGYYFGDFDEEAHWALGYSDPSAYEAAGSPSTSYNGKIRVMDVDNAFGLVMATGCAYRLTDRLSLDLSLSYTNVTADATFYGYQYGVLYTEQDGSFPLDNVAVRAGITFTF
jgi:outer membrane protein W